MKLRGTLNLSHQLDLGSHEYYTIFSGGRSVNISEFLNLMLMSDVYVNVKNCHSGREIFSRSGRLIKDKVAPMLYMYSVDGACLDSVLWDNVGRRLEIEIRNIDS